MTISISTRSAGFQAIMASKGRILRDARAAVYVHGADVRAELDTINTLDAHTRSRAAAAFAITSPQCPFDDNVRAVRTLLTLLDANANDADVLYTMRSSGYRMISAAKARWFTESSDVITQGNLGLYTFDTLRARRGFGPKTTSMALALNDENARVITLDTHMLAGLLGFPTSAHTFHASKAAYVAIANMLLAVADELNVSPFLLQWCLWCYYRNNTFESHLPIFGL